MKKYMHNAGLTTNDLLKLKIRREIYQFILKNPGQHFREICRKLNTSRGTVSYHTRYLEKRGLINIKSSKKYKLYYAKNKFGKFEEDLLHNIRFDTPRNILYYLITVGCASQVELSKELKRHQTTIEFYLKRLIDLDIIELAVDIDSVIYLNNNFTIINRDKIGREKFFRIKNQRKLYDLLIKFYKNKYYDSDIADEFFYFVEETYKENPNYIREKLKTFRQTTEELEKIFYQIFPNPYHC
jgi:predicted transcriptional regulator